MNVVNGKWCRVYIVPEFVLYVTYHKRVNGRLRQLTVSPKLLRRTLR